MCERGNTVELVIKGKAVNVDSCIAPIVKALNDAGITTEGCCCGHGKTTGHITLTDGRILGIFPDRGVYLPHCPIEID